MWTLAKDINCTSIRLIKAFKQDLFDTFQFQEGSADRYEKVLISFAMWIQRNTTHRSFQRMNARDITAWCAQERVRHEGKGFSFHYAVIGKFYAYLLEARGLIKQMPLPVYYKPTRGIKTRNRNNVPTIQEFLIMRKAIRQDVKMYPNVRRPDYALRQIIFEGLAGTGLRLDSLLTMTIANINWGSNSIFVDPSTMNSKNSKPYTARFTPYFAGLLREWIEERPVGPKDPIITSGKSTIKGWLKQLNPAPYLYLHPHSFRRLWCSVMYYKDIDGGARDGKWVSTFAGHSSEKTTEIYTKRYCLTMPLSDKELCDKLWEAYVKGVDVPSPLLVISA